MISSEHAVANLPRRGHSRKLTENNARWISRKVRKNPFVTRCVIKSDLDEAGIDVENYTISRALNRTGLMSRFDRIPFEKFNFCFVRPGFCVISQFLWFSRVGTSTEEPFVRILT